MKLIMSKLSFVKVIRMEYFIASFIDKNLLFPKALVHLYNPVDVHHSISLLLFFHCCLFVKQLSVGRSNQPIVWHNNKKRRYFQITKKCFFTVQVNCCLIGWSFFGWLHSDTMSPGHLKMTAKKKRKKFRLSTADSSKQPLEFRKEMVRLK